MMFSRSTKQTSNKRLLLPACLLQAATAAAATAIRLYSQFDTIL
jgi:hypothetical protein